MQDQMKKSNTQTQEQTQTENGKEEEAKILEFPKTAETNEGAETGKQSKKSLFYEILRFLVVGGIATIADYAVYYLFRQWILPPDLIAGSGAWDTTSLIIATALGFCCGLIVNWIMSVKFVFRNVKNKEESRSKKSFLIFAVIGLIGLGITELGMHFGVKLLPDISLFGSSDFLKLAWKEWIMKVVMTCIVLVWNYVGRKLFVFKS
jgi:putative flippase GtrA